MDKGRKLLFRSKDNHIKIDVLFEDQNVWLTQKLMADLFQTSVQNINMHIKKIFGESELKIDRTIKEFLIVQKEGTRDVKRKKVFYNLDAILAVGHRINSHITEEFRAWANEYISNNTSSHLSVNEHFRDLIFTAKGVPVMLDKHLAEFYQTETRSLKQAVRRNIERFPSDFMFELNDDDLDTEVSQSVIPNSGYFGGAKPFVFTEQGVSMLSAVIKTPVAVEVSLKIIRAFIEVKRLVLNNRQNMMPRNRIC